MICHYARASLIPNRQPTETEELSHLTIETPTKRLERAMTLKGRLEKSKFWKTFLLVVALLGVSFVICDGILTPCISGVGLFHYS
jgi:KUP system potassium uptake protein